MALAVWASLLAHALVLSLSFGGQALGLPGFGLPWRDRRAEVPDIRLVLLPAPAAPMQPAVRPIDLPAPAAGEAAETLAPGLAPQPVVAGAPDAGASGGRCRASSRCR